MKLHADKEGAIRHFTAKLSWKERFDPREIEMLTAGTVPMLIPPEAIQGKKNDIIQFNITPYTTLEFYLTCILSREEFSALLLRFIDLFRQMQRVYLNYKNLVLDHKQIYVMMYDRSLHLIYLPLADSKREASIPDFFRLLIKKANRSTNEQVIFLDQLLYFLSRPVPFALDEFELFIKGGHVPAPRPSAPVAPPVMVTPIGKGSDPKRIYDPAAQPAVRSSVSPVVQPPVHQPVRPVPPVQPVPPAPIAADAVVPSSAAGGTTILGAVPAPAPAPAPVPTPPPVRRFFIKRLSTGEQIEISGTQFLVGSDPAGVRYPVANPAISRRHAAFSIADGACFITDQNSTNKTYLNDNMLEPAKAYPLTNGDRIRLANEDFIFIQEG